MCLLNNEAVQFSSTIVDRSFLDGRYVILNYFPNSFYDVKHAFGGFYCIGYFWTEPNQVFVRWEGVSRADNCFHFQNTHQAGRSWTTVTPRYLPSEAGPGARTTAPLTSLLPGYLQAELHLWLRAPQQPFHNRQNPFSYTKARNKL